MGFFSWKTQDSDRSIPSSYSNRATFPVYMHGFVNGQPVSFYEPEYEGYGEFGGKDYYTLLAEMNPQILEKRGITLTGDSDKDRMVGIDIAFEFNEPCYWPRLTEHSEAPRELKYYRNEPEACDYQGYFYPEDDDDDEDAW